MTMMTGSYISCGVSQSYGLTSCPQDTIDRWQQYYKNFPVGQGPIFILFSDNLDPESSVSTKSGGQLLSEYIEENKLGTVIKMEPVENPNSGNLIEVFVCQVDVQAVRHWKP